MTDATVKVPLVTVAGKEIDCLSVLRGGVPVYIQRVELVDRNGNGVTDSVEGSIVTSDIDHYLIHAGKSWVLSDTVSVLSAGNLDILVRSGATGEVHIKDFTYSSTQGNADIVFYKTPTTTSNGVLQTLQNKSWAFQANTPYMTTYLGPTVTAVGTQLEHYQITGGKTTGGTVQGGGDEWVMTPNSVALIRYTNLAAQTDKVSYTIKFLDVG